MHLKRLALLGLLTVSSWAAERTYTVGILHWISYSPCQVAEQQGFWKEQGITVKVINFGSNQELNSALEHKSIDIAQDMTGTWIGMYQRGVPLRIIAETDLSLGGDKIIGRKDLDLTTLKGKPVGVYLDQPCVTYMLDQFLAAKGMSLAEVQAVEIEPQAMADQFISGRLPLVVTYDPYALKAEKEGNGVVVGSSREFPIHESFTAHADTLASMPKDDLVKILRGWVKAVAWVKDPANQQAWYNLLITKTFEGDGVTATDIPGMWAGVQVHDRAQQLAANQPDGGCAKYIEEIHAFLKRTGKLQRDYKTTDVFDHSAILAALQLP